MPKRMITRNDDEIGDVYDDDMVWWGEKLRSRKVKPMLEAQLGQPPERKFKLSSNHVLCLEGYQKHLIKGDPANRRGFPVLCSPGGLPVARLHGDLGENEVSWVLR